MERKCITLIANTSVWKEQGIILDNKETKSFKYTQPQNIFGEKDVYFEKIVANDDYTDNKIHCVVEIVDEKGKPISILNNLK